MVDEAVERTPARRDGVVEGFEGQARLQMIGERPAHDLARIGVHDDGDVDERLAQSDIGNVGDPYLIDARGDKPARQIGDDLVTVPAHRRARDERLEAQAQEVVEPHQPAHPLGVDDDPFAPQLLGDAPVSVVAVLQGDALDRIAQIGVLAPRLVGSETAVIAGPRQLRDLAQMLNVMRSALAFALRLLVRAQALDERVESFAPCAGVSGESASASRKALRKKSRSSCWRPTMRSSSSMRAFALASSATGAEGPEASGGEPARAAPAPPPPPRARGQASGLACGSARLRLRAARPSATRTKACARSPAPSTPSPEPRQTLTA